MRRLIGLISFLIFISSTIFLSFCSNEKDVIQEQSNQSLFLNLSSEAKYVGTKNCVSCHQEILDNYIHTGKGKAFHPFDSKNSVEDFTNVHVYDTFSGYHYTAFVSNEKMQVREFRLEKRDTVYKRDVTVDFVIGSGNQTRSYLFEEKGYFYEIPITWYVKKGIWDLSPGYENGANTRFSRPISEMCMNCHNSDYAFVDNSVNRFLKVGEGIGCEKCHGPGSMHIEKQSLGKSISDSIDYSIVNPSHLNLELQFDVCRQCHLEGVAVSKRGMDFNDYRPGLSLNDYWEVFIPTGSNSNDFGFASHVERIQMSKCFISSDGNMNCTSCHDAHKPLSENPISFYNEKCQSCHGMDACGAEHQTLALNENNCINCHMPKDGTTDIPHVSTSDHFIRVHSEKPSQKTQESDGLKVFKNFTSEGNDKRDMFLANLDYYEKVDQNEGYLDRIKAFIDNVERENQIKYYYLKRENPSSLEFGDPNAEDNPYTAFYISQILERNGKDGLKWIERAAKLAPENLDFANRLGNLYFERKLYMQSKLTYNSVLSKNRLEIIPLVNLGFIAQMEGEFLNALKYTKEALSLDPLHVRARENIINIYLNLGDYQMANEKLTKLIEDFPENKSYLDLKLKMENLDLGT